MATRPATEGSKPHDDRTERLLSLLVAALAIVTAVASARSAPSSWSDASRLATVESLVDHHTLAIDRSMFNDHTRDKVFIDGHFYSHKPPVPAVLMAGLYQVLQWTTGLHARETPDRFYSWITIGSSGAAYVLAVWSVFRLGRHVRLPITARLVLTASVAVATLALPYARALNEHILLLAVACAMALQLFRLAAGSAGGQPADGRLVGLGTLAGFGYALEAGAGLPLLIAVFLLVLHRTRSPISGAMYVLGALPWLALHHALNYAIGGTFVAVAMVPEFFLWPGSPFTNPRDLTGAWNHASAGAFVAYAIAVLVGPHGFILHNLPLWLAAAGAVALLRRPIAERPEIVTLLAWSVGTWLLYAALSTNYSGSAVSIRWFLPLIAAGACVLAVVLREYPGSRRDLIVLTVIGTPWILNMWRKGPWTEQPSVNLGLLTVALVGWGICRLSAHGFRVFSPKPSKA
jgi:hypothetical protein